MNLRDLLRKPLVACLCGSCLAAGFAAAAEHAFEVKVVARKVVDGPKTIRIRAGDTARLRWTSDEAMTVHLHGYDQALELRPGAPAVMRVVARYTGRFPATAHLHGQRGEPTLLYLEVHPE